MLLGSGLWVVDGFHPVAAVLDPESGAVRRVVSWSDVPACPVRSEWPLPLLHGDGTSLWVQHELGAALHRIDADGRQLSVWTGGRSLSACGPGVAWCRHLPAVRADPDQAWQRTDRLLRVDGNGRTTTVRTQGLIRRVQSGPDALLVELAVPPTTGSATTGTFRWVQLPWDAEVPHELSVAEHGVPEGSEPVPDSLAYRHFTRHRGAPRTTPRVTTDEHGWQLGWVQEDPRRGLSRRPLVATAHTADGEEVRRWDLGQGTALGTVSLGDRLAVTVARDGGGSEVLVLDPATSEVTTLLATDTVDTTGLGWPLVPRPVEADSYAEQVRAHNDHMDPSEDQNSDARATLLGHWPDTALQWTFRLTSRPGLLLRRRVPLFDDLGRVAEPVHAAIHLLETVQSGGVPPAEDAVDGVLDL